MCNLLQGFQAGVNYSKTSSANTTSSLEENTIVIEHDTLGNKPKKTGM